MAKDGPSPWQLGGLTVRQLARRVANEISTDEVPDRAAALAYYFVFALFPALLFLTALLGFLPVPDLMDRLMAYAAKLLPPDAYGMIQKTLGDVTAQQRHGLLSIGAIAALWAASAGMASVMTTLNIAYGIEEHRPWWKRRGLAVVLTLGFSVFVLVGLLLLAFGPVVGSAIAGGLGVGEVFTAIWNIASIPVAALIALVGLALVYYLAPAADQRWQWVTPGSVVAVVLWVLASAALRLYVTKFSDYNATYGSIGAVILLLLWLYVTGFVLLVGAEVNAEIEHAAAERGEETAKAEGEHAPPAARGEGRPATREAEDLVLAGQAIVHRVADLRERGGLPALTFVLGTLVGWLSQRPLGEITATAREAARTGSEVTRTMAVWERYRRRRDRAA